jgi:glycosyltransferase involved in cell wall biosynthesis
VQGIWHWDVTSTVEGMAMRIAQVAPLHLAVPPEGYGGTERVIAELTDALVAGGHEVTLFASGDSRTQAHLAPFAPAAQGFSPATDLVETHLALLTEVYRRAEAGDFDVIHSHLEHLTLPFVRSVRTPTVLTFHSRLDQPTLVRLLHAYPDAHLVSISDSQREPVPDVGWVATVYHGVDVQRFPFSAAPGSYLVFVGRIAPEKRPDRAIAIAKRAHVPLKIAAKVDPEDRAYFNQVVRPFLDDPLIDLVGPLTERHKRELMRGACALLSPIDWPEPFGMVFIEALACGTPVLTCPSGAAPEVVEDGVTGFIRASDDELVEAVHLVGTLDRATCRQQAEERFDATCMAEHYVRVYERVLARKGQPRWRVLLGLSRRGRTSPSCASAASRRV